ncbi:MAG: hypothetical protein M5U29_11515 [Anaerolineae bacterium]|nr:hypothetical protein [Anaerolineae bacterium]
MKAEYEWGWKITEAMPVNVLGFQTHRDHFAIDFERERLHERIAEMRSDWLSDEQFRAKYGVKDSEGWRLADARASLRQDDAWEEDLIDCLYRPFDWRPCYFSEIVMDRPRRELLTHVFHRDTLCLLSSRQQATVGYRHCWVAQEPANDCVISTTSREANHVFPLYLYPAPNELLSDSPWPPGPGGRTPNLAPAFVREMEARLGMRFEPHPLPPPRKQGGGVRDKWGGRIGGKQGGGVRDKWGGRGVRARGREVGGRAGARGLRRALLLRYRHAFPLLACGEGARGWGLARGQG